MHSRALYDWLVHACVGATFHFASALPPSRRPGGAGCASPSRTSLACDLALPRTLRHQRLLAASRLPLQAIRHAPVRSRCVVGDSRTCFRKPARTPRLRRFSLPRSSLPSSCSQLPVSCLSPQPFGLSGATSLPLSTLSRSRCSVCMSPCRPNRVPWITCWNSRVLAQNERTLQDGFQAVNCSAHLSWVFPPSRD